MLALGPSGGIHAVADDGSESADREVLVAIESEDGRAVGRVTHDGEGDNRHRVRTKVITKGNHNFDPNRVDISFRSPVVGLFFHVDDAGHLVA